MAALVEQFRYESSNEAIGSGQHPILMYQIAEFDLPAPHPRILRTGGD
jgi:hypothetical protein